MSAQSETDQTWTRHQLPVGNVKLTPAGPTASPRASGDRLGALRGRPGSCICRWPPTWCVDWPAPRLLLPWSASGSATDHPGRHILAELDMTSRTAALAYALTRELLS